MLPWLAGIPIAAYLADRFLPKSLSFVGMPWRWFRDRFQGSRSHERIPLLTTATGNDRDFEEPRQPLYERELEEQTQRKLDKQNEKQKQRKLEKQNHHELGKQNQREREVQKQREHEEQNQRQREAQKKSEREE